MSEETEMTADRLKEKLSNWFSEKENKQMLRTFLRSLIFNKLSKEDFQLDLKFRRLIFDDIDIAVVYFVCDFLVQNHFHYSLSVFSSEISSTNLHEYVCDYFNKISYKWNPKKPPMLEYHIVHNILSWLNINSSGSFGSDVINRYYLLCEGSLLKVVASEVKRLNIDSAFLKINHSLPLKNSCDNSIPVQLNDSCNHKVTNIPSEELIFTKQPFSFEEIEKYCRKKDSRFQRTISSQKQEFSRCRKILLSCHDALNTKLNKIHELMEHLKEQKNDIVTKLDYIKDQSLKEKLSVENQGCEIKVNKAVWEIKTKTLHDALSQTEIIYLEDKCTETVVNKVTWKHVVTQTDFKEYASICDNYEREKFELFQFIDQQQERIKILTDKTMLLTNKITSEQLSLPNQRVTLDEGENDITQQSLSILQGIINRSDETVKNFTFNIEKLKQRSLKVEKMYSCFLNKLLSS